MYARAGLEAWPLAFLSFALQRLIDHAQHGCHALAYENPLRPSLLERLEEDLERDLR